MLICVTDNIFQEHSIEFHPYSTPQKHLQDSYNDIFKSIAKIMNYFFIGRTQMYTIPTKCTLTILFYGTVCTFRRNSICRFTTRIPQIKFFQIHHKIAHLQYLLFGYFHLRNPLAGQHKICPKASTLII